MMNSSRPVPAFPLFLQPGQAELHRPAPQTGQVVVTGPGQREQRSNRRCCELPGCENLLPDSPGNEETIRYCCQDHRRSARGLRSRSRHGAQR